jgi:RNA recognition motif-containing protein
MKGRRNGRTNSEFSLFIGNLDYSLSQDNIHEFVMTEMAEAASQAGEEIGEPVVHVRLKTDFGRSRGFGHVDFADEETRDKALKALQFKELGGRQLSVDLARGFQKRGEGEFDGNDRPPRQRQERSKFSIFLGNLSWDAMKEDVEDMVNDLMGEGKMTSVRMAIDRDTGKPRGYCHIDFVDGECQEKAIGIFNGLEFLGRVMRADYATESRPNNKPQRRDNFNNFDGPSGGDGDY